MARMDWTLGLSEDRSQAVLQLNEDGQAKGHILYEAAELEAFIRDLAKLRANMTDQVPVNLDPGSSIEITNDPSMGVPDRHSGSPQAILLALRHPGLGWLGFGLPARSAAVIGQALTDRAREA